MPNILNAKIRAKLSAYIGTLQTMEAEIREMYEDEDDKWNEKSEKWQDSEKGQDVRAAVDMLESIADTLTDSVISELEPLAGDE